MTSALRETPPGWRATPRMRDLPTAGRPRERLMAAGPAALSEAELLAVVLGTGDAERSALGLATSLLTRFAEPGDAAGLGGLVRAGFQELQAEPGMGPAKAARLVAAFELGRRSANGVSPPKPAIAGPTDAWTLLAPRLRGLDREHFFVLPLDSKHRLLDVQLIAIGTLNATLVHPREVFKGAVRLSAAAVLLAHNHPSGDPTPSPEDLALTAQLLAAGELLGIRVLDHLVCGDRRYVSLRETTTMWAASAFHR